MRREFEGYLLNTRGLQVALEMATRFSDLLTWIHSVADSSPELTIAGRKLEEACFYAKKAMAIHPKHQAQTIAELEEALKNTVSDHNLAADAPP